MATTAKGGVVRDGKNYDPETGKLLRQVRDRNNSSQLNWEIDDSGGGMSLKDLQALDQSRANIKAQEDAKQASQGYGPDGRPLDVSFDSMIDPATGLLKSAYQLEARPDVTADQRAVDAIRSRGLAQGPSDWAKASLDKQKLEESGAMDSSRQQSAGAQAQTLASLMMRGGLSSGSRERLAGRSARDQMMAAQGVVRQGQQARADIGVQDENFKTDALKTTAGYDFQNAGLANQNRNYATEIQGKNLSAALNEINAKRGFEQEKWKTKMQEWGAGKTADAQKAASGGGKK